MDNSVLIALFGASSSGLVAITALLLNYRGFASMEATMNSRFASLESSMNSRFASVDNRFASIERRLDMQVGMKDFNKALTALQVYVALVKDKVGL
jgi:hypothetical protein